MKQKQMPARGKVLLLQVGLALLVLIAWQLVAEHSKYVKFVVGAPLSIGECLYNWFASGVIYRHLAITLLETLLSFAIGTVLGVAFALWLSLSKLAGKVVDPFIKALNAMPKLILAPIFSVWFGLGIRSKVALGTMMVFFVIFFNVYQGLRDVNPIVLANARMMGASRQQLIRRVYIPSATIWVFSSLHLAVGIAFIGSVIGEYLGSSAGVGYLILQAEGIFDSDTVLAGVLLLSTCALLLDWIISLMENNLLRWHPRQS